LHYALSLERIWKTSLILFAGQLFYAIGKLSPLTNWGLRLSFFPKQTSLHGAFVL
jgi:hypothetical protein